VVDHLDFMPGVLARSVTAAVGNPPTQKNASILRSLMALTDSATPDVRAACPYLVQPRGLRSRGRAMTSVALRGNRWNHALALEVGNLLMRCLRR